MAQPGRLLHSSGSVCHSNRTVSLARELPANAGLTLLEFQTAETGQTIQPVSPSKVSVTDA